MPENEPIRRFVPLPTQFLQEEEPSDTDEDDDEQNAEYNQPLAHFQHPAARSALTSTQDHHLQPFSSGRAISSSTFYGISQRSLNYGQNHGVADDMSSGQTLRNFMGRHIPKNDDCSQNSYDYQEVFDDPHQLIPSYHEYSITDSPTHSYSPTSGDSAGIPEYFISRGASTVMRSGGLGYGSHTSEQGNTVFCEPQQRLQEPKVISNESNRVGSRNFTHILYKFKRVFEVEQNVRVSSLGYVRRKNVLLSGSQCSSELMKCLCAAILMLSRKVLLTFHV